MVLEIDQDNRRLSLGLKQTEPNPWDMINTKYRVGDKISGSVRNVTDFGAFVEVEEGIDGLVHISDLSWTKRVNHPSDVLNKGDSVEAVILKIDSDNQRLSLGVKQLQPNVLEDFFQSHGVGDVLKGQISRLTEFGAFVQLFDDVEGLVHVSELSTDRVEKPEDSFAVGQEVRVKIIKIDPVEKKIGLSIKAALNEPDTESVKAYFDTQSADGSATLGDVMSAEMFNGDGTATAGEATAPVEKPSPPASGEASDDETPAAEAVAAAEETSAAEPEEDAKQEPATGADDEPDDKSS